jgi:hypothetical protein
MSSATGRVSMLNSTGAIGNFPDYIKKEMLA